MVPMWFMDRLVSNPILLAFMIVYTLRNPHVQSGISLSKVISYDARAIGAWSLFASMFGFVIFDSIQCFKMYHKTYAQLGEPIDMYALGIWNIIIVAFKFSAHYWLLASWTHVDDKYLNEGVSTSKFSLWSSTSVKIFRFAAVATMFFFPILHISVSGTPPNVSKHVTKLCFTVMGAAIIKMLMRTKNQLGTQAEKISDPVRRSHIYTYVRLLTTLAFFTFIECTPMFIILLNGLVGGAWFCGKSSFIGALFLKLFNFGATLMCPIIYLLFFPPHDGDELPSLPKTTLPPSKSSS